MLHQTVLIRMLKVSFRLEGGVDRLVEEPEKVILCSAIEVAAHSLRTELPFNFQAQTSVHGLHQVSAGLSRCRN